MTDTAEAVRVRSLFDLTGRVALVTGGTRGIGLAIAEGLIGAGAAVTVAGRKADACASVAEHLTGLGGEAIGVPANLSDEGSGERLVGATVERFGRLDVVVNNAATALAVPLADLTLPAWEKVHNANVRGPVFLVQAALPFLKASPSAAVVNVISVGAFTYTPGMGLYSGSKAAMMSWTRTMATELAPFGIRVNALAPGAVDTDMVRNNPVEVREQLARSNLFGRLADPWEMVGPALFLVSEAASYMTGQVLFADAGMLAH